MAKKIEVEDYGQTIGDAVIVLSKAVKESMLTTRAIALLVHDQNKSISLTDCQSIIQSLPRLAGYYTKGEQKSGE